MEILIGFGVLTSGFLSSGVLLSRKVEDNHRQRLPITRPLWASYFCMVAGTTSAIFLAFSPVIQRLDEFRPAQTQQIERKFTGASGSARL